MPPLPVRLRPAKKTRRRRLRRRRLPLLKLAAHVAVVEVGAARERDPSVEGRGVAQVFGHIEVDAHEEQPGRVIAEDVAELLRVDDVAAGLVEQAGDGVDDALGIGAREGEDKVALHRHGGPDSTQPPWCTCGL